MVQGLVHTACVNTCPICLLLANKWVGSPEVLVLRRLLILLWEAKGAGASDVGLVNSQLSLHFANILIGYRDDW